MKHFIWVILLAFPLFLLSTEVRAQALKTTLETLTETSSGIVLGKTTQKRSFWNDDRTRIYTEVQIQVSENLKGNSSREALVTIPGGQVGNTLYEVSDMPIFVEGEEVLVFLWDHPTGKTLVAGGAQGKLEIEQDEVTGERRITGATHLLSETAKSGVVAERLDEQIHGSASAPLSEVISRIKSSLEP